MKKTIVYFVIFFVVLAVVLVFLTFFGSADISFTETLKILANKIFGMFTEATEALGTKSTIIWQLRFPRTLLAFLVGGALAICGGVYQAIFKNPMADPFVLGVSSGAAFGATIGIIFKFPGNFLGQNLTSWFAFLGSLLAIFFVYNIARVGRYAHITSLLLSGTALNQFLTAIISFVMMMSDTEMKKIYFWTLGSFSAKGWSQVGIVIGYVIITFAVVYVHSRDLDIIMLGDDTAVRYGLETEKIKRRLLFVTSLAMSACVSVSGIIGFVGLISPHVVRLFSGPAHKKLIPFSFMFGGTLMALCDTIARSLMDAEIPVGIISAIFGAPFFIYLLRAKKAEVM